MNLKDILKKGTTLSRLKHLKYANFGFNTNEVPVLETLVQSYRAKNGDADHSPEIIVYLSYCYQELKGRISGVALYHFGEYIDAIIEGYENAPNAQDKIGPRWSKSTYKELRKQKFEELEKLPEKELIISTLNEIKHHFKNTIKQYKEQKTRKQMV